MRFRSFEPHEEKHGKRNEEDQSRSGRSVPEVGQSTREEVGRESSSLPLEWRKLAPFVEAHRSQQPTQEYLEGFTNRLMPQLRRSVRQGDLVREYLSRTFWRRWTLRMVAATAILGLALIVHYQRREIRDLRASVQGLEQKVQVLQAGMGM